MTEPPYWQDLVTACRIELATFREPPSVLFRVHQAEEQYDDLLAREFGLKLGAPRGQRQYLHAQAVVFAPRIIMEVALAPAEFNQIENAGLPHPSVPLGITLGSRIEGQRQLVIGNAQAWFYPAEELLVLWEAELFHSFAPGEKEGAVSAACATLWQAFETLLAARFPGARRMLTPGWEPGYETAEWQAFLQRMGYSPAPDLERAFVKVLEARPTPPPSDAMPAD